MIYVVIGLFTLIIFFSFYHESKIKELESDIVYLRREESYSTNRYLALEGELENQAENMSTLFEISLDFYQMLMMYQIDHLTEELGDLDE